MPRDESKNDPHWKPLFETLEALAAPLFAAGWKLVSTETDESWEFGDSAFYDLERGSECIELEYYEHGPAGRVPQRRTDERRRGAARTVFRPERRRPRRLAWGVPRAGLDLARRWDTG